MFYSFNESVRAEKIKMFCLNLAHRTGKEQGHFKIYKYENSLCVFFQVKGNRGWEGKKQEI